MSEPIYITYNGVPVRHYRERLVAATGLSLSRVRQLWRSPSSRRRLRLWMRNPLCHWCLVHTLPLPCPNGKHIPHESSIDHFKSRGNGRKRGEQTPLYLTCYKCNHERDNMEQKLKAGKKVPIEWLRKFRSGLDGDGI